MFSSEAEVTNFSAVESKRKKKITWAYEAWKGQATNIEQLITDQVPFSSTKEDEAILHLKDLPDEDSIIYENILLVPPQRHETRRKMDLYDALTHTLEQTLKQNCVKDDHTITNEEDRSFLSRPSKVTIISNQPRAMESYGVSSLIEE